MDIQQRTETIHVQMYQFDMTEAEALNVCADPSQFQADLRRALNVTAEPASNSPRKNGGGKRHKAPAVRTAQSGTKIQCPQCGEEVGRNFINRHNRRKHPELATAN